MNIWNPPVVMKAQYATDGNNNGVEGMMRSSYEVMKVFTSSFTAVLIIGRLSFWIVLVIFVFGALYFLSMDRTKRKDKKIWDECSPYWYKLWYMLNTMTDFTYGKDIRLFSMGGWLVRKYAGIQDHLQRLMCESKNRWMGHTIFSNLLGLVNLAIVYGYLIGRVLAGERLAVVGLNGAGKSTFIKLLCGLYVPTSGRILLNGIDIRRYDKREYYELFAPVFQNVELFAFSMGENVSMRGSSETDTDRTISCLRDAGLSEKLDTLPKGVETQLLKVLHDDGGA